MEEEVFQLHVAIPTYATCPMSPYKAKQSITSPKCLLVVLVINTHNICFGKE